MDESLGDLGAEEVGAAEVGGDVEEGGAVEVDDYDYASYLGDDYDASMFEITDLDDDAFMFEDEEFGMDEEFTDFSNDKYSADNMNLDFTNPLLNYNVTFFYETCTPCIFCKGDPMFADEDQTYMKVQKPSDASLKQRRKYAYNF